MGNSLQAALEKIKKDNAKGTNLSPNKKIINKKESAKKVVPKAKTREDTVLIGAHVSPIIQKQLRILAAEESKKQHVLISEALELLFAKYGKNKF